MPGKIAPVATKKKKGRKVEESGGEGELREEGAN